MDFSYIMILDVYYVVSPYEENKYKVSTTAVDGGISFEPELPDPAIFEKNHDFRDFMLTKGIS
jgi:hypothetical protein